MLSGDERGVLLRELISKNGGTWITIAGASMEPTLPVGTRVRIYAVDRIRTGDVVAFHVNGELLVHRVIACVPAPGGLVLFHKGDARAVGAGILREKSVLGRVQTRRRTPPWGTRIAGIAVALINRFGEHIRVRLPRGR